MKTLFIISFAIITHYLGAQHYKPYQLNDNNILFYDHIIHDENTSGRDLYVKSKKWIAKHFIDGKDVDIYSDEQGLFIIGKGAVPVSQNLLDILGGEKDYLNYTINIYAKEGKARLIIDNISHFTFDRKEGKKGNSALESLYWYGKKRKPINGQKKRKERYFESIVRVVESWEDYVLNGDQGYGDF